MGRGHFKECLSGVKGESRSWVTAIFAWCKGKNKVKLVFCNFSITLHTPSKTAEEGIKHPEAIPSPCIISCILHKSKRLRFFFHCLCVPSTGLVVSWCVLNKYLNGWMCGWMSEWGSTILLTCSQAQVTLLGTNTDFYSLLGWQILFHFHNFIFRFKLFRPVSPGIEEADQDSLETSSSLLQG